MSSSRRLLLTLCAAGGLGSAACSEAVPPASEGAFSVAFQSIPTGGKSCMVKNHNINVGTVSSSDIQLLKDTVGGSAMQCAVTANGGGFRAVGLLENNGGAHLDFRVDSIAPGGTGTGSLGYRSVDTVNVYRTPSDKPCKFSFSSAANSREEIALGRLWMDFTCEQIADVSHNSSCAIQIGTVAMQNCDQ